MLQWNAGSRYRWHTPSRQRVGRVREGLTRKVNRVAAIGAIWAQVPTVDDIEQFLGADQWTLADFFWAVAILVIAYVLSRFVRRATRALLDRFTSLTDDAGAAIARGAAWFVVLLGSVSALSVIGIDLGPTVMLILVFIVIMFFAGRGIMANFSAGLVLQGSSMFEAGDQIVTPSGTGVIKAVTARTVVIETLDGRAIDIPNKTMIGYSITNLTKMGARLSTFEVGVAFGSDLGFAKAVLVEAANGCNETHSEPPAEALIIEFGDNAVTLQLRFWHGPTILEELRAVDVVAEAVSEEFARHGIKIPYPQRTLWWADTPNGDTGNPRLTDQESITNTRND
jgi:small conductance mechanosensitive channel